VIISARFIKSAAAASDFDITDGPELVLVGRSNVGKSTLINALARQRIARASGTPGTTRLANIYAVTRGRGPTLYVVDLPGYGYARGGSAEFGRLIDDYFVGGRAASALLLVDARHPALDSDVEAWRWLTSTVERRALVATKIDKLSRAERQRAMQQIEAVHQHPVLPVSADTGEGLDELWKLIDELTNNPHRRRRSPHEGKPRPRLLPKK
jgi:GTP-binding protein